VTSTSGTPTPAPVTSSTAPTPAGAPASPRYGPTAPLAPTTPTPTPTPTSPTTAPTPTPTPNPTPATDVDRAANDLTTALNSVQVVINQNSNGIIAAINSTGGATVTAVGKVVDVLNANGTKQLETANKTNTILGQVLTELENRTALENALSLTNPASGAIEASKIAAKAALESSVGQKAAQAFNAIPAAPTPVLTIATAHGFSVDLDPRHIEGFNEVATFIRAVVAWVVAICFEMWAWRYFRDIWPMILLTPQAKGNQIAAGIGGQGTSYLAATAITAILVTFPTLFWAAADSGVASWLPSLNVTPVALAAEGSTILQRGAFFFYFFMPVGTMLSALTSYFIIVRAGILLFSGVSLAIKWIFP